MKMRYSKAEYVEFSQLVGKTIVKIIRNDEDEIKFITSDGEYYILYHRQEYCETVYIESIEGDLQSLVGNPILIAEEVKRHENRKVDESFTWTFYKLATIKGHVDIRWYGSSNGYHSESVDFVRMKL